MSFSPQWALQTSHPYAQYYGDARYPGNTVIATTGSILDGPNSPYATWIALLMGAGVVYGASRKKRKPMLVALSSLSVAILSFYLAELVIRVIKRIGDKKARKNI